MVKAVRFHKTGGPEVLTYEDIEVGSPGEGQARVKNLVIGLNFIDTYHRSGLYPLSLPHGVGMEAAGVIEEIGPGVQGLNVGDRVAYCAGPPGAYSEARLIAADRLVPLPDGVRDEQAAAMMLKGLTVWYLTRKTYRVVSGETILFHAAAGGVGLIACQWLKALGATVIGTVSTPEKAEVAKSYGCDHTIIYTKEDFTEKVLDITNGQKVPVVFDSVGKDTFRGSIACLKPRGLMCVFGNGSGPVESFNVNDLAPGSFYLTRPTLMTYAAARRDLLEGSGELFGLVADGKIKIDINQTYQLADAAQAHRDLEDRKTTGSTILLP